MSRKPSPPQPPDAQLTAPADVITLNALAELHTSRRDRTIFRAIARIADGEPVKSAARAERISRKTLNTAIADYNQGGTDAIMPVRRGRPFAMSDQDLLKTRAALLNDRPTFQAWTPLLLSLWIKEQFGVRYRPDALANLARVITDGQVNLPAHVPRKKSRGATSKLS